MAKEETPQELDYTPVEIDDDVKRMMGLPPDEAAPVLTSAHAAPPEPTTPTSAPAVSDATISEIADAMNKQIATDQATAEKLTESARVAPIPNDDDDELVDAVVDDIVAKEGDELLAAEDAKIAAFQPTKKKHSIRHFFGAWWRNKRARNITISIIFASLVAIALVPFTRYKVLNFVGVRASMSIQVIDEKSGFPIKGVDVSAGGAKGSTDDNGKVTLQNVLLGKTNLDLAKRSFAPVSQSIVVGWGSNPYIDPIQMKPVGSSYSFIVKDAMSDKPIAKAEISDGESVALSGDDGRATLTIQPKENEISLKIKAKDYRDEQRTLSSNEKSDVTVALLPGKPDVFVSKRSGKYDLYKRDVDGKNEAVLLAGTGSEQESTALLVNTDTTTAAYVSSRDGKRNKDGFLLSNLYMVDINAKSVTKVEATESEQIQLIDWIGDKLIFVKIVAGPSGNTTGRQRIISYDIKQDRQVELASANYFNDVEVLKGKVYYAISGSPQLVRINADNSSKTTILDKETWVMYRTTFDKIQASAANNKWYEQNLADATMKVLAGAPASPTHRVYIDNPSAEKSVWLDVRDGKGVLLLQDTKTGEEKTIISRAGLSYPIHWISDKHLIIRISNNQETANYILNIDGGDLRKIGDVTNTTATNRWYYYR